MSDIGSYLKWSNCNVLLFFTDQLVILLKSPAFPPEDTTHVEYTSVEWPSSTEHICVSSYGELSAMGGAGKCKYNGNCSAIPNE